MGLETDRHNHDFPHPEIMAADSPCKGCLFSVALDRLWSFLSTLKANDENGNLAIPDVRPADDAVKALAKEALGGNKGAGWAARLFEECELNELPATVTIFLSSVFALFPAPPPINENGDEVEVPADPDAL